jgi:N-acylneuraminate cytidylyltransferase
LKGHPLIAYSIASALAASSVTRLLLSTDDEEIAAVGRSYGAATPFLRPAEMARDDTPDLPVFQHALTWLIEHENYRPDVVVQLRPTTPLRPIGMIDQAVTLLCETPGTDCVRGVVVPKQTPYKMWRPGPNGTIVPLLQSDFSEPYNMPRQKLPTTYWQTGHIDAISAPMILSQGTLTGKRVKPLLVPSDYSVDIDTAADFELVEQVIEQKLLKIDFPAARTAPVARRPWPEMVDMVVFDFDGVFTDNKVYVHQDGCETVLCDRGDGMGISLLRQSGVPAMVLSTEVNPIVGARCRKLNLPSRQGLTDKAQTLKGIATETDLNLQRVMYVGNDVNDLECMRLVGFSVAVADAHPSVLACADLILCRPGGNGAIRELCDLILERMKRKNSR